MTVNNTDCRLRVAIATSGRFHVLDLARELDALGVDVSFYSYVPRRRATRFGLPSRCHVALLPFVFPLVALERLAPATFRPRIERLMCWALDLLSIVRMRPCDIYICMSGIYVQAARFARWRYGAKIIVHRGSRHIISQQKILAASPGALQVATSMVQRELRGYAIADKIAVPSRHVTESFEEWPDLCTKLFVSPYGVDLRQFPLCKRPPPSEPTVLFVGHWSYRKGADALTKAIEQMTGVRLVHVGALGDVEFPTNGTFVHHAPVPQWELKRFYESAHVFALASREEGLALVQCQALASGLPLVCTDRTGGADLAELPGLNRFVRVVPAGDPDAFRRALTEVLADRMNPQAPYRITEREREALSWRRYAAQHLELMRDMVTKPHELWL